MKDVLVRRVVGVAYDRLSRDWPNLHSRLQLTVSASTGVHGANSSRSRIDGYRAMQDSTAR
jgi:hypothetical protein